MLIFITFLSFYNSLGINKSVQEISTFWARSVPDDRTFPTKELKRIGINIYICLLFLMVNLSSKKISGQHCLIFKILVAAKYVVQCAKYFKQTEGVLNLKTRPRIMPRAKV